MHHYTVRNNGDLRSKDPVGITLKNNWWHIQNRVSWIHATTISRSWISCWNPCQWHDFQRETQFHGVVVAWIEFSLLENTYWVGATTSFVCVTLCSPWAPAQISTRCVCTTTIALAWKPALIDIWRIRSRNNIQYIRKTIELDITGSTDIILYKNKQTEMNLGIRL